MPGVGVKLPSKLGCGDRVDPEALGRCRAQWFYRSDPFSQSILLLLSMTVESLEPMLELPSNGSDCGYPGMLWLDGLLWVSYNSSHEGKTNVYLARVQLSDEQSNRK
jgi:hypothetical protein